MDRLVTIPEESMVIPQETYDEMMNDLFFLGMILNALYENATLDYTGQSLVFNSEDISAVLLASPYHRRYEMTLAELKEERDERSD